MGGWLSWSSGLTWAAATYLPACHRAGWWVQLPCLWLPHLRVLEVARNRLQQDGSVVDLSGLAGLTHLDLRQNCLTRLPRLPPQPNSLAQVSSSHAASQAGRQAGRR